MTPPTVHAVLQAESARAVWPLVIVETLALTVEIPLGSDGVGVDDVGAALLAARPTALVVVFAIATPETVGPVASTVTE